VYIEYDKIGDVSQTAELLEEHLQCEFTSSGFDLKIHNFRGDHQLRLSNLKGEIEPEQCTVKKLSSKLLVSMQKKDTSSKWYDLLKK
jgi:hypothetical protein